MAELCGLQQSHLRLSPVVPPLQGGLAARPCVRGPPDCSVSILAAVVRAKCVGLFRCGKEGFCPLRGEKEGRGSAETVDHPASAYPETERM